MDLMAATDSGTTNGEISETVLEYQTDDSYGEIQVNTDPTEIFTLSPVFTGDR